jgi:hypothetical protein
MSDFLDVMTINTKDNVDRIMTKAEAKRKKREAV